MEWRDWLNDAKMITKDQTLRIQIKNSFMERLVTSFLDIIILTHFKNDPFSGYDILLFIQKQFNIILSPGTVYSVVYAMERKKLITGSSKKGKRTYTLTEKGRLTANIATSPNELQSFMTKLTGKN